MFVDVENARNPDRAARRLFQDGAVEKERRLFVVEGRFVLRGAAERLECKFAAVSAHELFTRGEAVKRQVAVIAAAAAEEFAPLHVGEIEGLFVEFRDGRLGGRAFLGEKRRPVGAHVARDVGADHFASDVGFKGAEHPVVQEGSALDDDVFAEFLGVADAKDLVEGVANDRVAKARRDVVGRSAVALGLTHLGIHEDRAAGAEVDGRVRAKRRRHEFGEREFKLVREGLQEGSAARAAGFVQGHAGNESVLDGEALHVLAADVDHVAHVGLEVRGRALMRERFDFGPVGAERRLGEFRPVARRADRADARPFGKGRHEGLDSREEALQRISFVSFVPGGKEAAFAVDQNALHRGAAEVDP